MRASRPHRVGGPEWVDDVYAYRGKCGAHPHRFKDDCGEYIACPSCGFWVLTVEEWNAENPWGPLPVANKDWP